MKETDIYSMGELITEEVFAAPQWQKITYRIVSLLVFALGINVLMIKNGGWLPFLAPVIFFIAVSMFLYSRQKLIISNSEIRFVGGFKRYSISWTDITKVDMVRLGKYKTPTVTIYYSGGKLNLNKSYYLEPQFTRILLLIETRINPELYTKGYWEVRNQLT
ncbi:hypothetical protein SAMN05421542_2643 [Chryseobacterium jejuense]|uniref:Bacterial membrane flanked domain n=2 Tax=Chryseobacterium jejuense TaxID=445960 RepID=A0A2X2VM18_CHRJE|nr:hypothetical protein SAMN05421542_2643 [Chryseobacterium jejuense]SQB27877.1 Uncharacterised protein [Chryseobacterium jejuense]